MSSPVADNDANWQQAPDGDLSTQPLPGEEVKNQT
jgi:hypothetical protein